MLLSFLKFLCQLKLRVASMASIWIENFKKNWISFTRACMRLTTFIGIISALGRNCSISGKDRVWGIYKDDIWHDESILSVASARISLSTTVIKLIAMWKGQDSRMHKCSIPHCITAFKDQQSWGQSELQLWSWQRRIHPESMQEEFFFPRLDLESLSSTKTPRNFLWGYG